MEKSKIKEMKKKRKGFTLIELIIVIAIIAILAAIAIPKFGAVRQNANIAADQANGKNISLAIAKGIADGEIVPPTTATDYALDKLPAIDAAGKATTVDIAKYIDGINKDTKAKQHTGTAFTANIDPTGNITVKVGSVTVYPDPTNAYK